MLTVRLTSFTFLAAWLAAQGPQNAPPSTATATVATKGDEMRRAFVDADGGRAFVISAAAEQLLLADKAGRERFMATLRAIAAVAPKAEPAAASPAAPTPAPAPVSTSPVATAFSADMVQQMTSVVTGDADAQKASLAKLAGDQPAGAAALKQLDDRGRAILARGVQTFVRKKVATNALYAGQYLELRDFHPESSDLLLLWAKAAPRGEPNAQAFRTACLRALRDTLAAEHATDRIRADLREVATKAQSTGNDDLFLTTACALHQYGDPEMFDRIKATVLKEAESKDPAAKLGALNTLANLHYQLRKYDDAATYYAAVVTAAEAMPDSNANLPTLIYNTACSLALAGKVDEAFTYLEKALVTAIKLERPFAPAMLGEDHDLDNLRKDPRYQALLDKHVGKTGK